MRPSSPATVHRLARDRVLRLRGPLEVVGRTGTLWITIDGEPDDIVLEPGHARRFDGRDVVLVYALGGDATLQAQTLAPRRLRRLVARVVQRVTSLARAWTAPRALGARP